MKKYLTNALSLNMFRIEDFTLIRVKQVSPANIPKDVMSVIGHKDTASVVSNIIGFEVPFNRVSLQLEKGDVLYVAQYSGPRLPEGATQLPEGAIITFLEVTLKPKGCGNCGAVDCNTCGMMCWFHGCDIIP